MLPFAFGFILALALSATLVLRLKRVFATSARTSGKSQGKQLEELSRLTGGLAHEIKNPLSTIKVNLKLITEEVIGEEALELPPRRFSTVALWFDLPDKAVDRLVREQLDFAGGLHATEHAAIGVLPLFALCDRNDIGGVSTPLHPDTGHPQVFIYDAHPGGIGIAERGFDLIKELWQATLRVIAECPCQEGCPSCIQSPKCGNNNQPLDKRAAQFLLEGLITKYPNK